MKKAILYTYFLFVTVFFIYCAPKRKNGKIATETIEIVEAFNNWKSAVMNAGTYSPYDSCNTFYFIHHPKNSKLEEGIGLPDSTKFNFHFCDINNDKQIDALITFHPECCTCTDTTGKVMQQEQVIIISNQNGYTADDTFFQNLVPDTAKIHIDIDSVSNNTFYGTYFYVGKQSTSIEEFQKSISVSYNTKEVKFIKRKNHSQ